MSGKFTSFFGCEDKLGRIACIVAIGAALVLALAFYFGTVN